MKTYHVIARYVDKNDKLVVLDETFQSEHEGMDNIESHLDIELVLRIFLDSIKERQSSQIAEVDEFIVRYEGEV